MQQSDLFGGLSIKAEPAAKSTPPVSSGFSFLSKPPPTSPAGVAAPSAFSFLSPAPAPAAAPTSAFGFLSPSPPPAPMLKPTPPASTSEPRKRRIMTKRPGHARELGEIVTNEHAPPAVAESSAAPVADPFPPVPIAVPPQSPQQNTSSSSYSVLAGLTVHVPEVEDEPPQQLQREEAAKPEPVSCLAQMESILFKQHELTQLQAQLIASQAQLSATLQSLDSQQEQATLQEDFDLAQNLQLAIDETKHKLVSAADDIVGMQHDLQELDLQREDVFIKQHFELEMLADKLLAQSRSAQAKLTLFQQQTKQAQEQSWSQLESALAALEKQVEVADTEQASAAEELALVEERKAVLTADLRKERTALADAQLLLEDEVAALEQQLAAKLAELDTVVAQTNSVEDKIALHEAKYASRTQEVEARVASCKQETSALQQTKRALNDKRDLLTAHCEQERLQCETMQRESELAKQQAAELARLNQVSTQFQTQRKQWRSLPKPNAQAASSSKERELQELDREIKQIELNLQQDTKLVQNTAVVEELETQKQLAIQLRNFKEAGRLAAELKLAMQRRAEALQRMDAAKLEAEQKNTERASLVRELDQANAELDVNRRKEEQEKLVVLQSTRSEFLRMLSEVETSQFADGLAKMLQSELASVEAMILLCGGNLEHKDKEIKQDVKEDDPMSIEELENMLSEAIASEDFDAAEEVSSRIENKREFLKQQAKKEQSVEEEVVAVKEENDTSEADAPVEEEEENVPVTAPVEEEENVPVTAPVQVDEDAPVDAAQNDEEAPEIPPVQDDEDALEVAAVEEEDTKTQSAFVDDVEDDDTPFVDGDAAYSRSGSLDDYKVE